jgi:hypothetical protein
MSKNLISFQIGNKSVEATYDEWEELFEKLEDIFGIDAVEDQIETENEIDINKLDKLDVEIYCDQDISEN